MLAYQPVVPAAFELTLTALALAVTIMITVVGIAVAAGAMRSTATTLFGSSERTSQRVEGAVQSSNEASLNFADRRHGGQ